MREMREKYIPTYGTLRLATFILVGVFLLGAVFVTSLRSVYSSSLPTPPPTLVGPARDVIHSTRVAKTSKVKARAKRSHAMVTTPLPAAPSLATYESTCTTPQTAFNPGDTVCVKISGIEVSPFFPRRVFLGNANSTIVQSVDVTSDPQTFTFVMTSTSVVGGQTVDNRGTWRAIVFNPFFFYPEADTAFTVDDPANPTADVGVTPLLTPTSQTPGSQAIYDIEAKNYGPDNSANVQLTNSVPAGTTFVSFTQLDGPTFTCTSPTAGASAGTTTCTLASFAWPGAAATFRAIYQVNTGATVGSEITNTTDIVSGPTGGTDDQNLLNNSISSTLTVVATGGSSSCVLTCPDNINAVANTTESSVRGAHVTFDAADADGSCGAITASPASGSFFPVGTTTVTVTSETGGGSCSFTVTVEDNGTNPPNLSCPSPKTGTADSTCSANISVGTATATGDNVTIFATRSDGKPMYTCDANNTNCVRRSSDDPFPAGVTTITWIAHSHSVAGPYADEDAEIAARTGAASCTQTVTVDDVTPPSITPPANQTGSADATCQFTVPDYTSLASVSDNCACDSNTEDCQGREPITITQSPAPGTVVGLGTTTITLTANDGSSNNNGAGNSASVTFTVTVSDTTPPTFTSVPANVTAYTGPGATTCDTVVSNATLGTATATDNCSTPVITRTPSGNTFPVGTTTITWKATDAAGNFSTATQTVTVIDNTVPTITLNGTTPSMWPPNHAMQTFTASNFVSSVFDNCGGVSVGSIVITNVTSDELDDATGGGDGNTINDIQIAADCKSVQLRSERSGNGNGRVYTITFRLTDTHGNSTTAVAHVVVPHDQGAGPETVVDSGVHYSVNSNCP
jgi:uncharacterized repeat protein (TIGR01451 family)